jgi:hypothetical protein
MVATRSFRDFPLFIAAFSNKSCPSGRCTSVTNTVYKGIDGLCLVTNWLHLISNSVIALVAFISYILLITKIMIIIIIVIV